MAPTERKDVVIIGGGVIGVCCAYYLAKQGRSVCILEKEKIAAGSSSGNAGLIVPSLSIPLAAPGVAGKGLKWMLNSDSPFYIKPRMDFSLLSWLLQFIWACRKSRLHSSLEALSALTLAGLPLYDALADFGDGNFGYERKGLLGVYLGQPVFESGLKEAQLLKEFGIESKVLNSDEIHSLEPTVVDNIFGGVYYPGDCHLIPDEFVHRLADEAVKMGVVIHTNTEVVDFAGDGRKISSIKTNKGDFTADFVVLAAGSWSSTLAHRLRTSLPLQPAKGYSVTANKTGPSPKIPLLLGDAKAAITPMGNQLRVAGTLELSGFDSLIDQRRVKAIIEAFPLPQNGHSV